MKAKFGCFLCPTDDASECIHMRRITSIHGRRSLPILFPEATTGEEICDSMTEMDVENQGGSCSWFNSEHGLMSSDQGVLTEESLDMVVIARCSTASSEEFPLDSSVATMYADLDNSPEISLTQHSPNSSTSEMSMFILSFC